MKKIFFFFLLITTAAFSQRKMDSLNALLKNAKYDTTRLRLYLALGDECELKDNLKYAQPAIDLIERLLSQTTNEEEKRKLLKKKAYVFEYFIFYYHIAKKDTIKEREYVQKQLSIYHEIRDTANIIRKLYLDVGNSCRNIGNLPQAFDYFQKGLAKCEELNYKKGIALCLAELGDMYSDQEDTSQAIEIYKRMLSIAYELNDKNFLARTLMKAGGLYNAIGNFNKALEYYQKGKALFEEMNDMGGRMEIYKNTGHTYKEMGDYETAVINYKKAVQLAKEMEKPIAVVEFMSYVATTYADMSDFKNAVDCIDSAKKYNKDHIVFGDMQTWLNSKLAKIYYKQKDFKKAKQYSDLSLEIMKNYGVNTAKDVEDAELAAKIDSACGNYKEAYFHYQQYIILRDKLNSDDIRKAAAKEKYQNEYDKQKAIDKEEQDKKDIIISEEKRRQLIIIWSVVGGLLLVVIFAGFILRSLRVTKKQKQIIEIKSKETEEQKELVEEKNKEVMDSIRYASRIQRALITSEKYIANQLNRLMKN